MTTRTEQAGEVGEAWNAKRGKPNARERKLWSTGASRLEKGRGQGECPQARFRADSMCDACWQHSCNMRDMG